MKTLVTNPIIYLELIEELDALKSYIRDYNNSHPTINSVDQLSAELIDRPSLQVQLIGDYKISQLQEIYDELNLFASEVCELKRRITKDLSERLQEESETLNWIFSDTTDFVVDIISANSKDLQLKNKVIEYDEECSTTYQVIELYIVSTAYTFGQYINYPAGELAKVAKDWNF